jgi:hypothetical protein
MIYTQKRYTLTYRRLCDEMDQLTKHYRRAVNAKGGGENSPAALLLYARMESTLGKIEREEEWMVGTTFHPYRYV